MRYISFWNFYRKKRIKIKLYRLGHPNTLDVLKQVSYEKRTNTILLLDALDEDPNILQKNRENIKEKDAITRRIDEIIEVTRDYREVVITCRTQFFFNQNNNPYELKIERPDGNGNYYLNILYISPFTNTEIKKYLNKKYLIFKFWKMKEKKKALRIVLNSPKLMVRPMLLDNIDLLIKDEVNYKYIYDIYETLIVRWLEREAKKVKLERERKFFERSLREISFQISLRILDKYTNNLGLFISKTEVQEIADFYSRKLTLDEITGKSLLTIDGVGNWKFAHKSIWEFFLADRALNDLSFYDKLVKNNFLQLDMLKIFCDEKYNFVQIKNFHDKKNIYNQNYDFLISRYLVTQKLFIEIMGFNPSFFNNENCPVEHVDWYRVLEFCNKLSKKHRLEPYYKIDKKVKDPDNNNPHDKLKYKISINKKSKGYRLPYSSEWTFVALGGNKNNKNRFSGSNTLDKVGWYESNSKGKTHPVGEKDANELGIFDMSGNVAEWCFDWYKVNPKNTFGQQDKFGHVTRGGGFNEPELNCKIAKEDVEGFSLKNGKYCTGFRLARNV